jgi:hypothetical protein
MWALTIALGLIPIAILALPAVASAENCPNAVFRSGPSSRLPDCRAYEMVTPPYKEGYPVDVASVAEDGGQVLGDSIGTFAGSEDDLLEVNRIGQTVGAEYLFTRNTSGWSTIAIDPSAAQYPDGSLVAVSSSKTESLWAQATVAQAETAQLDGAESPAENFYVRDLNGPLLEVGPILPPSVSTVGLAERYAQFQGVSSADLGAVLFSMRERHWPGDETEPGAESLYEYVGTGNSAPLLVGVNGGPGSLNLVSQCGTQLGSSTSVQNAVSANGDSVFFTAAACGQFPAVAEVFARVDSGLPDAHTVAISEPSKEDCLLCDTEAGVLEEATFQGASTDGSRAFFTTSQPLLGSDTSNNLYEYDSQAPTGLEKSSEKIIRISTGDSTVSNPTAAVERVLYVSPDGSRVFFSASGVLTERPNGLGQKPEIGKSNLYLYERDAEYPDGRTVFVMPYAEVIEAGYGVEGDVAFSQDGQFLTFKSYAHLTSDDLSSLPQGFEYDSQTGGFARYSIGQEGFNDGGNTGSPTVGWVADDGSVYFESTNPLVPQAVSGQANVYEYREGNVSMISSGQDTRGAHLDFISPSGTDVYFQTFDQLVTRDTDSQVDTYDARIDGGFPESPRPLQCEADACQGPLSGAPVLLSPGSEFQATEENVTSSVPKNPTVSKATAKLKGRSKKGGRTKRKQVRRKQRAKKSSDAGWEDKKGGHR